MAKTYKIAVIVGSLRKEAYSKKVALALKAIAPSHLDLKMVEIGDMPYYNEDLETASPPPSWTRFRDDLRGADGVLFVTPEYNRSIPAAVKNAVDVGSRPYGKGIWDKKPCAIISISQGAIGGFGSNHQLRQALMFGDVYLLNQPEAYLGLVQNFVTDDGKFASDDNKKFMQKFLDSFEGLIKLTSA